MNNVSLELVAARLEGLEETIITKLIDRAQFRRNAVAYQPGRSGFEDAGNESLFELRLRYQEEIDAVFGRFTVPEERPFSRDLPSPKRRVHPPNNPLRIEDYDRVNLTPQITAEYLSLLDELCPEGDDAQYGSSVEHDVFAVQAISRRIHFGAFYVAESKFRAEADKYRSLIEAGNAGGIETALTRKEVEQRVLHRVSEKVQRLQSRVNTAVRTRIDPGLVLRFYRSVIIPLTKQGEVTYLLARTIQT
jgi:chorismate mutase